VDVVVDDKYLESVAYHEAGHAIVAAAQGLPILREGVRLDRAGCGLMCYRYRNPDLSIRWKEAVVVSFAGLPSQQLIYPDCPTARSQDDEMSARSYMMVESLEGLDLGTIKSRLRERSRFLVEQYSESYQGSGRSIMDQTVGR
jgi:ATP-dependent Zn protease